MLLQFTHSDQQSKVVLPLITLNISECKSSKHVGVRHERPKLSIPVRRVSRGAAGSSSGEEVRGSAHCRSLAPPSIGGSHGAAPPSKRQTRHQLSPQPPDQQWLQPQQLRCLLYLLITFNLEPTTEYLEYIRHNYVILNKMCCYCVKYTYMFYSERNGFI